jgi:hypothetical protein
MKIAIVLTCLFCLSQPLLAQTNCFQAKATFVDVCVAGTPNCAGTITQGGILNGTTVTVFTGGPSSTPDAVTFTFANTLTITTIQGQLKVKVVNLFHVPTTVASGFGNIDTNASTGRFAGATGTLFINGKAISDNPFTVKFDVSGEICLAN